MENVRTRHLLGPMVYTANKFVDHATIVGSNRRQVGLIVRCTAPGAGSSLVQAHSALDHN